MHSGSLRFSQGLIAHPATQRFPLLELTHRDRVRGIEAAGKVLSGRQTLQIVGNRDPHLIVVGATCRHSAPIPVPLAQGTQRRPPWPWSVNRWLEGEPATIERVNDPVKLPLRWRSSLLLFSADRSC